MYIIIDKENEELIGMVSTLEEAENTVIAYIEENEIKPQYSNVICVYHTNTCFYVDVAVNYTTREMKIR